MWKESVGNTALDALEHTLAGAERVIVLGAPFLNDDGERGMHDVHMNQGDPKPKAGESNYNQKLRWWENNGIWQDGAVIVRRDGKSDVFLVKFVTQSMKTDDLGRPA